jgi:hypothetical protein
MKAKYAVAILVVALASIISPSPAHAGAKFKVLHSFGSGKDGAGPYGQPVLDGQGNLYGVTGSGRDWAVQRLRLRNRVRTFAPD